MRYLIVTRHAGAVEWLASRGITGAVKSQICVDDLVDIDAVVGVLPIHLAVAAHQKGIRPILIQFDDTPPRGAEYSAAEMDAAGAYLAELCLEWRPLNGEWEKTVGGISNPILGDCQEFRIGLVRIVRRVEE